MLYRNFRQLSTGQWLNVLMAVDGSEFSVKATDHRDQIAAGWGLAPADLEVLDGPADARTGVLLPGPVIVPPPDPAIAIAAAAVGVVAEIDKAFTVRTSSLTNAEKTNMRDKVLALIATAQGR